MKVPAPPSPIPRVNLVRLAAGTVLCRFFDLTCVPGAFNPCMGKPSRFAPLRDGTGRCIPTLYAGETKECAAFETIFRDVPLGKNRPGFVRFSVLDDVGYTELTLERVLRLASLYGPDQKALGAKDNAVTRSSPKQYLETVKWARAFHDTFADVDGLIWTSSQCDPASAYVLFGDRVAARDLSATAPVRLLSDAVLLGEVHGYGARARIVLVT